MLCLNIIGYLDPSIFIQYNNSNNNDDDDENNSHRLIPTI
jgi:hypothetical protein